MVCTRRGDHSQTRITVSDHATTGLTVALLVKWGLAVLAAIFLPIFLFKIFIVPFKILLGLKAISLLNSLLLGSLLLKYKFSKPFYGYPIAGTVPASSASSSSSASSAAATSHSLELSDETADYVDVVRPNEDLRRILNMVKKRNKNWWTHKHGKNWMLCAVVAAKLFINNRESNGRTIFKNAFQLLFFLNYCCCWCFLLLCRNNFTLLINRKKRRCCEREKRKNRRTNICNTPIHNHTVL